MKRYVNRIESHVDLNDKPDYSYGFLFFVESRAINRRANYFLAKQLLKDLLNPHATIASVFEMVCNNRDNIVAGNEFTEAQREHVRGIHSSELNGVIKDALAFIKPLPAHGESGIFSCFR